jgi:hypothetical protein
VPNTGFTALAVAGNHFKLCWAHEAGHNAALGLFRFELDGNFEIHGPWRRDYTCTLGIACVITLEGYGFSDTNKLVILDRTPLSTAGFVSCGSSRSKPALWEYSEIAKSCRTDNYLDESGEWPVTRCCRQFCDDTESWHETTNPQSISNRKVVDVSGIFGQ